MENILNLIGKILTTDTYKVKAFINNEEITKHNYIEKLEKYTEKYIINNLKFSYEIKEKLSNIDLTRNQLNEFIDLCRDFNTLSGGNE